MSKLAINIGGYGGALCLMVVLVGWHRPHMNTTTDGTSTTLPITRTTLCVTLWCLHYTKRLAEVFFVHIWSSNEIPLVDGILELVYYWGFGAWIARDMVVSQRDDANGESPLSITTWLTAGAMVLCMVGNGEIHLQLRRHRPYRQIRYPTGRFFDYVSCPHYLFEILTWFFFAILSKRQYSTMSFCVAGSLILMGWAKERHEAYQKHFLTSYPTKRKALIPFYW